MPIIIRIYERSNQLGYRQSAVQRAWKCPLDSSFIRPGFTVRFLPSLSRNVRWIYEDNYTLLSLTIRPSLQTEWQTTLLRTVPPLFSLFLFRFHSLLLESSRRVCPSFSFDEHSVDFVRSHIEFRLCNPGIRITPSSSDRCKCGKWTRTSGSGGFCFSRVELFIFYNGGWSAQCSERFIFCPERNGIGIHPDKVNIYSYFLRNNNWSIY